jgi:hypothetical protein
VIRCQFNHFRRHLSITVVTFWSEGCKDRAVLRFGDSTHKYSFIQFRSPGPLFSIVYYRQEFVVKPFSLLFYDHMNYQLSIAKFH